ncbi:hypothetical protein WKH56_19540 [Priestia sp. SB1]|uniref:hypothetical protein n=1 Tax=Priestia sp. SB1 TaxID=3132359 RepID=UPI00317FB09B
MKKEYFGYLGGDYEKLGLFINKKDAERGIFPDEKLDELFEEFKEKPVKITVETFESVEDTTDKIKITSDSGISYPTANPMDGIISHTYTPPVSEECHHKKIYDEELLTSNPPKQKWTCSKCGEKGMDVVVYGSYQTINDYSITADKFKNHTQIKVNDEEIQLRATKEELDDLRDRVKKYESTITDNTDEISQTVSKTEFKK